ncbi:MAG: hypothetical protein Q7T93_16975 [Methylobacterium sp.]|uniref:hypothetical protein n=1 Tax=Methylobacterium sp. TaxID=409 RepID=UPI002718AEA2|nr:hypothetical protein [Methylobacterium sp.]MDO9428513.1 hypothetical protein [Methylobacterium sp.]
MTLRITEDDDESGGHAFIDLGRRATAPLLSFRRQDAEPRHLGTDGWQPEVAWLAPLSMVERDGRTVARFGPAVVDRIEELVPIEIVAQDGTSFGVVSWPFITPAPAGHGLLAAMPAPAPSLTQTIPLGTPVAVPTPDEAAPPEPEPDPAPRSDGRTEFPAPPPAPPPRRFRSALALVLVVLLVGAGSGAYLFRDALRDVLADRAPPLPPIAETPPSPAPPAPEPPRLSGAELRQRHAQLLQERAGANAFLALGGTAIEARQGAAAFRAFEEADPVASADAAWQIARFYDPRNAEATYRDAAKPNVARAAYYYALWRNRSPRHTDELRGLCEANTDLVGRDERLRAICRP